MEKGRHEEELEYDQNIIWNFQRTSKYTFLKKTVSDRD